MHKIFAETGANQFLPLNDPSTGLPMGWVVEIRPSHSEECKAVERRYQTEIQGAARRNKDMGKVLENRRADMLRAAIAGWDTSNLTFRGEKQEPIPFDAQQVKNVCTLPNLEWAREQIERAMGDTQAFFEASQTS